MGGSSGSPSPGAGGNSVPIYQFANQPTADRYSTQAISNLYNNPNAQNIYNQALGSLGGIPQFNTGYDPSNVTQQGRNIQDASAGLPFLAQRIAEAGFDPQGALFQQMQQQVTDQTNAQLANSGLSGSPFAAGIMGQNLSGLDINWQNNQLNRELQAAQGAGSTLKDFGTLQKESAALQFMGPQSQAEISNALSGLNTAALSQDQQAISDWLQYLSEGTQAGAVGASEQMSLNDQALQAQQMNMQAQQAATQQAMQMAGMGLSLLTSGKG